MTKVIDPTDAPVQRQSGLKNAERADYDLETSLLLASARKRMDAAGVERIQALVRQPLNWEWLARTAVDHGVFPLLYNSLQRAAADAIPPATLSVWRGIFYRNAASNLYLAQTLTELMGLLETHGIRAIPYKGPALAASIYGKLALRWAGDLDLLVHPHDYKDIKNLLVSKGYNAKYGQWHESEFVHPTQPIHLDIHRSFTPRRYRFTLTFDDLWDRRTPVFLTSETSILTVCLADLLIILSIELIKEFAQPTMLRLIRITDMFELIQNFTMVDPLFFIDTKRYRDFHRIVYCAVAAVCRMYGIHWPSQVQRGLYQEYRLQDLVDETIALLFLNNFARPVTYFHQLKTILLVHDRLHTKSEVLMYSLVARGKSYVAGCSKRNSFFSSKYAQRVAKQR